MAEHIATEGHPERHELQGFSVQVLSVPRTTVEKVLGGIKNSYNKDTASKWSNRIRHLYDIHLILTHKEHRDLPPMDDIADTLIFIKQYL